MRQGGGLFITLEGGDGSGKSTQVAWLVEQLQTAGVVPVQTREPGGTELGEQIRRWVLTARQHELSDGAELLLLFAARMQHVEQVILPALERGCWVLCERFTDATYAYQGGGRGLPATDIAYLEGMLPERLRADMTLFFDVDPAQAVARKKQDTRLDRFERETLAFHERVQAVYRARATLEPERIKTIRADLDIAEVRAQLQVVLRELPLPESDK